MVIGTSIWAKERVIALIVEIICPVAIKSLSS
ncbi:hypothetical protein ES707_14170 [subsurface metagenome]